MSVANSATPGIKNISRSKVTAGSTSASRYSLNSEKHTHSKESFLRSELLFGLDEYSKVLFEKEFADGGIRKEASIEIETIGSGGNDQLCTDNAANSSLCCYSYCCLKFGFFADALTRL